MVMLLLIGSPAVVDWRQASQVPEDRREIIQEMRNNEISGIASLSAADHAATISIEGNSPVTQRKNSLIELAWGKQRGEWQKKLQRSLGREIFIYPHQCQVISDYLESCLLKQSP
jgi:hypothetical protein